ncbi:MAG: hypothetical protein AAGA43_10245 [Bacteroidota bacterium]
METEKTEEGLLRAIKTLIEPDENFDLGTLDSIYHKDMVVIMLDQDDNKNIFKKPAFMELIGSKLKKEDRNENKWAKFFHSEVNGNKGHILVKRRNKLVQDTMELIVILDFVWEDNRWQVIREIIFSQAIA